MGTTRGAGLIQLPRRIKLSLVLAIDIASCVLSVAIAYYLRLGEWVRPQGSQWLPFVVAPIYAPIALHFGGLYRAIIRYSGWSSMFDMARAVAGYAALSVALFTVVGFHGVPRTLGLIQPIVLFLLLITSRALARQYLSPSRAIIGPREGPSHRMMIYGAGDAGRQVAGAMERDGRTRVVCFVDDDPTLHGRILAGVPIFDSEQISRKIVENDISDVILALPSVSRRRRQEITDKIRPTGVTVRTLPGLHDIVHGRITIGDLREVEIEDLLGRDPVAPDPELLGRSIRGKTVLITGAGGSIGSALSRQALAEGAARLVIVDSSEFNLYEIERDLLRRRDDASTPVIVPRLASVTDAARMRAILAAEKPHTLFHAAAFKHVPLVEANVVAGLLNNAIGTRIIATIAREAGVERFILISTDKAVRPTNVMGASKRLAELILQAMAAEQGAGGTIFSMVRFGNVLGSSGSVIPLFREQIKHGGPITLTDNGITRYFMTIPEAAELVVQAGAMAQGGEVFVLDMGEPVRIRDLAERMIELSGLRLRDEHTPDGDIEIRVTGLRPGEKLYEELLIGDNPEPTPHERIMKANELMVPMEQLAPQLAAIENAIAENDVDRLVALLRETVEQYQPATH